MTKIHLSLCLALLACATPGLAQESRAGGATEALQTAMTPAEFKATGLNKLNASELAALNSWLQRKVSQETAAAVAEAKQSARKEVERENRGFFNFGSEEPIISSIKGEFTGFSKGRQYVLANGQVWEQVETATLAGVRKSNPKVRITPSVLGNKWFLKIDGYNTTAPVQRIK